MSVRKCNRLGCDNIMCDRCSPIHGYICNDCFEELVNTGVDTSIEFFMVTRPNRDKYFPPREFYEDKFPII